MFFSTCVFLNLSLKRTQKMWRIRLIYASSLQTWWCHHHHGSFIYVSVLHITKQGSDRLLSPNKIGRSIREDRCALSHKNNLKMFTWNTRPMHIYIYMPFLSAMAVDLARNSAFIVGSFLPFLSAASVDLARNYAFIVGSFSSVLPIMTWNSNTSRGNIREREQLRKASMSIESHVH